MLPPGYMDLVRRRESGGNDNAKNPLSSASGRYQFIDSTFLGHARGLYPGMNDQQLLAMKNNPDVQEKVMGAFTAANTGVLTNANLQPTAGNLYLSHFLGPGGAVKALKADPNTPLSQVLGPDVLKANPFLNNIPNVAGLVDWANKGGGGGAMNPNNMQGGAQTVYEGDQQGFNLGNFFGNNLVNAGAALASINSPAAAAAIGKLAQNSDQDFATSVNQQTGQIIRVNKKTGATQVIDAPQLRQMQQAQAGQAMQDELRLYEAKKKIDRQNTPLPKASDGVRKMQDKTFETARSYAALSDDMADILSAIENKEVDYNLFNNYKNTAFSILGLSPEKKAQLGLTPRAVEVFQKFERLKNVTALEEGMKQAGVETDRDFFNAIKANFGSNSFDGQNVSIALNDLLKKSARVTNDAARLYEARSKRYADDDEIADPFRLETIVGARDKANKYNETLEQKRTQQRESGNAPQAQPQQGGPARITSEEEFKRLPTGATFIGPDGKTYRKN